MSLLRFIYTNWQDDYLQVSVEFLDFTMICANYIHAHVYWSNKAGQTSLAHQEQLALGHALAQTHSYIQFQNYAVTIMQLQFSWDFHIPDISAPLDKYTCS